MGLGLPGLARLIVGRCRAMPGAGIPREVEMLLLERGFPPWNWDLPHGGCCRSALPQESDMGWHFCQQLSQAGGRDHGQTNPGPHLTRGKGPLCRKKQLCGQKKIKLRPAGARRGALGTACVFVFSCSCTRDLLLEQSPVLSLLDTGAARRVWGGKEICPCPSA